MQSLNTNANVSSILLVLINPRSTCSFSGKPICEAGISLDTAGIRSTIRATQKMTDQTSVMLNFTPLHYVIYKSCLGIAPLVNALPTEEMTTGGAAGVPALLQTQDTARRARRRLTDLKTEIKKLRLQNNRR